jgi:hypothetical protein
MILLSIRLVRVFCVQQATALWRQAYRKIHINPSFRKDPYLEKTHLPSHFITSLHGYSKQQPSFRIKIILFLRYDIFKSAVSSACLYSRTSNNGH